MTAQEMEYVNNNYELVEQTRPVWNHLDHFTKKGKELPVTFLICQKNTKVLIQLALESLLRFYPDVNILVVDDDSNDDSKLYLQYKELVTPNLKVWYKGEPYRGHGGNLHEAMVNLIETEYVMVMDSDVIIERGGFLEEMLDEFKFDSKLYAIGTLQISSYKNNGGEPENIDDITLYPNPQLSLFHAPTYHELEAPFILDGTPLILNAKAAKDAGLKVMYYPTDLYMSHNSGSSWTEPRTVWIDDHDVKIRPFLTVIVNSEIVLRCESGDYDIVVAEKVMKGSFMFTDGSDAFDVDSKLFPLRHKVIGEYVADYSNVGMDALGMTDDFVTELKRKVIEENVPDETELHGIKIYKRQHWQKTVR